MTTSHKEPQKAQAVRGGRFVFLFGSILGIGLCLLLIQTAARFGFSRMHARYASLGNYLPAADEAVRLSPSDPEAHRTRAAVLNGLQMPAEAAKSLETASSLRYRDDYLWIELGNTREELGDTQGALPALDQAVRWAPYYAHTHWQRGNLLLRMGKSSDAFAELRKAALANPGYIPTLIDLAWGIAGGDVKTTEALLQINNDTERLALTRFLARKGKGKEVIDQTRSFVTPLSVENKNELARLLLASKAFREAFSLLGNSETSEPSFRNGSFEEPLVFSDSGFGWIIAPEQRSRLAIDVTEKLSGAKSLQIKFDGAWTPGTPLLSQTVIVKSGNTYRLSFGVRTKDLVTGGPPVIIVSDATTSQLLGKSENLPTATTSWIKSSVEFTTLPTSQAAIIRVQRNNCDSSPCPIFGTLWLDEFSIEQIQSTTNR
jgi:tetratricopeptide (TPR) repeat protein